MGAAGSLPIDTVFDLTGSDFIVPTSQQPQPGPRGRAGKNGLPSSLSVMETTQDLSVNTQTIPKSLALWIVGISTSSLSTTDPKGIVGPTPGGIDPSIVDAGNSWEVSTSTGTTGTTYIYYIPNRSG